MTERAEEIVAKMTPHEIMMFQLLVGDSFNTTIANSARQAIIIHVPTLRNLGLYSAQLAGNAEWLIGTTNIGREVLELIKTMNKVTKRLEQA